MSAALQKRSEQSAVLVVDDSVVARAVMGAAISAGGRLSVAASVPDAASALAFLKKSSVAAIVLDVEMPGVDGLTALPDLIAASGGAPVLIVSSACADGAQSTLRALALGAADTLVKPSVGDFAGSFATVLEERLARLIEDAARPASRARSRSARSDFDIIAIGASTGGIHALSKILGALDPTIREPILITQHLPESFMSYFANQVALLAHRPCVVAEDSMRIAPWRVVIAPGDAHITLVKTMDGAAIRLSRGKMPSGCCPSVDPMLESAAKVFGARTLAIVLSGMGRDGELGAAKVAAAGGSVVVQDKGSSVVWGMPGAIANAGLASAILTPEEIGRLVASGKRPC